MAETNSLGTLFQNIANAIRSATGATAKYKPTNFASVISAITNRGAWSSTINAGASVTIPAGYHNGSGKVSANNKTISYYSKSGGGVHDLGFVPDYCNVYIGMRWHSLNLAGWCRARIWVSNDNSNWTLVYDSGNRTPGANAVGSYYFGYSTKGYRYIKVGMDGDSGDMYLAHGVVCAAKLN